jgi:hypothetical protein
MSSIIQPPSLVRCAGPLSRRGFMQFGLAGMATLSWPGLLKLRAENAAKPKGERKSIIMVWLPGGQSHIDTYDPKPDASSEYRGPFKTISTKIPGTHFTELLPMNAKIADKFTVLRSMHQTAGGHPAGTMQMFSGDTDTRDKRSHASLTGCPWRTISVAKKAGAPIPCRTTSACLPLHPSIPALPIWAMRMHPLP